MISTVTPWLTQQVTCGKGSACRTDKTRDGSCGTEACWLGCAWPAAQVRVRDTAFPPPPTRKAHAHRRLVGAFDYPSFGQPKRIIGSR